MATGTGTTGHRGVLVLGIGNLLWGDEGFGVRAVQHLDRHWVFGAGVRVMDGGTQGLCLVQAVREAHTLVVFDAVDYGLPGGTLKLVEGEAVPRFLGCRKLSLHQTGFQEVLALAELYGESPERMLLVGVQPVELEDYGGSLTPPVKAQIGPAVEQALAWLEGFGIRPRPRGGTVPADAALDAAIADMERYERERPPATLACRHGDPRVLCGGRFRPAPPPSLELAVALDHRPERRREED